MCRYLLNCGYRAGVVNVADLIDILIAMQLNEVASVTTLANAYFEAFP